MKEATMYPHNPNSAESVLTEKLKDVSYGWFDNQRAIVLEAMQAYADQQVKDLREELNKELKLRASEIQKKEHLQLLIREILTNPMFRSTFPNTSKKLESAITQN